MPSPRERLLEQMVAEARTDVEETKTASQAMPGAERSTAPQKHARALRRHALLLAELDDERRKHSAARDERGPTSR